MYQLGHDLKTPLTPLVALLPGISKKVADPMLQEKLRVCINNVEYMKELVFKTLEIFRMDSSIASPPRETVNLFEELNVLYNMRFAFMDAEKIHFSNKILPGLCASVNKLLLREVVNNLIDNAHKYMSQGGEIRVDAVESNDRITVSVHDTGMGISKEYLEKIFDEFFKVDSSRHDRHSSGLGLSVCKKIIEKDGGKIWAESEGAGKGTTFYFTVASCEKI
jgi:signal transduction histidine kinase